MQKDQYEPNVTQNIHDMGYLGISLKDVIGMKTDTYAVHSYSNVAANAIG
jgi:hypothetical protein